jgi:uncharacterized protein HemX
MAEKESSKNTILTVVGLLLVTALGSGGVVWQWQQHKLDTVMKATDLWKQENDLYSKMIDVSDEYAKNMHRHDMNATKAGMTYSELSADTDSVNKMVYLKNQLDLMRDTFTALETKLSQIEGRAPRRITLEFIPPHHPDHLTAILR